MAGGPFRQQCPSCEAMILIKDPKQIGKKADCPKCKYRFVIERPAEDVSEVEVVEEAGAGGDAIKAKGPAEPQTAKRPAAAPAGDAKKDPAPTVKKKTRPKSTDDDDEDVGFKAKKKDGSGNVVLILGIGLAVLALGLLVAGGWFIFMTSDGNTGPVTRTGGPTTGPGKSTEPEDETPKGPKFAEITNLLPNDTQGVYHFHARNLVRSLIGMAGLETAGAFERRPVEDKIGIGFDDVDEFVIAHNLRNGWLFTAVRTNKPVNIKLMQEKLGLQPADAIKKQPYYVSDPSPWLDNLAKLFLEVNFGVVSTAAPRPRTLAVRVVDEQTFVIGDVDQVKAFLEAEGKPKIIAKADPRPVGNAPKPTTKWLTISQPLKNVLDRIEAKTPFIGSVAWDLTGFRDALQGIAKIMEKAQLADPKTAALVDETQAVGVSLQIRETSTFTLAVDARSAQAGTDIQKELRNIGQQLSQQRGATFDIDGFIMTPPPPKVAPGQPPVVLNPGPKYLVRSTVGSNVPMFTMEVQLPPPEGNQMVLREFLRPQMILLRGLSEMASAQPRLFELANALQAYVKKNNAFPRGTIDRKGTNFGRPFPPDQRVSWMAELLPFLGYEPVFRQINPERGWRPEADPMHRMRLIDDNARAGAALIPAFIDAAAPPSAWWVTMPTSPGYQFGATHFVAVAGVGLDAAEYAPDDTLNAKKIGVFGYNRVTKLDEVKDGLPNTIVLIQVPPTYKRPWIAGGGATVTGVPETKSIAPFVAAQRDGKKGTYAVMGDGAIRFISADISDDLFKALVTINGGEKVELDKSTVLVPVPEVKK